MLKRSAFITSFSALALGLTCLGSLGSLPAEAKTVKVIKCQKTTLGLFKASNGCKVKAKKSKKNAVAYDPSGGNGNSGGGGSGGGGGGGGGSVSDIRLKEQIHLVGTTVFGLPLYDFSYIGHAGTYEGVMAQDVLKVMPEAVYKAADGYYRVKYNLLGITMKKLD